MKGLEDEWRWRYVVDDIMDDEIVAIFWDDGLGYFRGVLKVRKIVRVVMMGLSS